jgi:predicted 3-demethylubiquinone-9 3-methyltransferase (glyoxalase superfamily)
MPHITPFLWFDNNLEEAMMFYASVFKDAQIGNVTRLPEGTPGPEGKVMSATFVLEGQEFMALNGGPTFKFNEAVSFFITVDNQEEVDYYWDKLTEGGQESQCGWLKDKFGLSWQVVPAKLNDLLGDPDQEKSQRVMQAMLSMKKIIIADLEKAAEGE